MASDNRSTRAARPAHPAGPSSLLMAALLGRLRCGELLVTMPDGSVRRFAGPEPGPSASVTMHDGGFARRLLLGQDVALAEGYMDGSWDTPNLEAVLDLGLTNIARGWLAGVPFVTRPAQRLIHAMRDNGPRRAKRNIAAHYDLGNDFYQLWLDPTMTYSSACELDGAVDAPLTDEQLQCAQRRKWDRILELIDPARGDRVLEIGCGWGGFAIHAAKETGCRVTGLTLSEEQAAMAARRVAEEGLDGLVDIRLQDYRDVPGAFDRIASIEMFEAVGERWWPTFFGRVKELLVPGGSAAFQVITIAEENFEHYRHAPDFIQRYVFPGGMLPSAERFAAAACDAGLTADEPTFFGSDYFRTLGAWSERFERVLPQVRALGFDERFIRMWRYYLAYCRTGFDHGSIDVMQVRLQA